MLRMLRRRTVGPKMLCIAFPSGMQFMCGLISTVLSCETPDLPRTQLRESSLASFDSPRRDKTPQTIVYRILQ